MSQPIAISPKTTALLVMDLQSVLLETMLNAKVANALLNQTAKLLNTARGWYADHLCQVEFRPGYPEISANNLLFSSLKQSGMLAPGSAGTQIHDAVTPQGNEPIVIKHRVGPFARTDLETLLRANGINTLILTGLSTSGRALDGASRVRFRLSACRCLRLLRGFR